MNLLELAEENLEFILEDANTGTGIKVVLISPAGTRFGDAGEIIGESNDIGFSIDPETGTAFQGRTIEVNLRLSKVLSAAGVIPGKNWKVEIRQPNGEGTTWTFAVSSAPVDRTLGIIKLWLNFVEAAS
jgi:hypothetical protein